MMLVQWQLGLVLCGAVPRPRLSVGEYFGITRMINLYKNSQMKNAEQCHQQKPIVDKFELEFDAWSQCEIFALEFDGAGNAALPKHLCSAAASPRADCIQRYD